MWQRELIMKRAIRLLLIIAVVFSLTSCKMFRKPTIERIHDIRVVSIDPDKSVISVSVIVNNPNNFKIRVDRLKLEILDKDRARVGHATLAGEVDIPKRASINLDFSVVLDTRPVVKMVSSIDQKVQFFVTGKGRGKAIGFSRDFEFEEPYELALKEHLEALLSRFNAKGQSLFKIQRTSVEKVGISETELHVHFILLNPYGFSFNFKGFPAEVFVNNKSIGKGNLKNQLRFDESIYSKEGVMVFKLSNVKSLLGSLTGVFKGEVQYTVKGKVMIDALGMEINRPYQYNATMPLGIWDMLLKL